MKKRLILPIIAVLLLLGVGGVAYKLAVEKPEAKNSDSATTVPAVQTQPYREAKSGVELALPLEYEMVKISPQAKTENSSVVMQLQRPEPQSFVIVQHDTGLSGPAALLNKSTLEYVESTIRQFYPVRYGSSYSSESLERTKIGDRDAIEHIYSYTDKDGKPNKVRLLSIIWSDDETYNIILQSSEANFERIKDDMNYIKSTFKTAES